MSNRAWQRRRSRQWRRGRNIDGLRAWTPVIVVPAAEYDWLVTLLDED